jgi:hypothetical protein
MIDAIAEGAARLFGAVSEIFGRIVPRRKKRRFRWLMMGGMLRKVMEGSDGGYGEVDSSAAYNDTVAIAITTYAGRLCLADGHADEEELEAFSSTFSFPGLPPEAVKDLLREAVTLAPAGANAVVTRIVGKELGEVRDLPKAMKERVMLGLLRVAGCGGISKDEFNYLRKVSIAIDLPVLEFQKLYDEYMVRLAPQQMLDAARKKGTHAAGLSADMTDPMQNAAKPSDRLAALGYQLQDLSKGHQDEGRSGNSQLDAAFQTRRRGGTGNSR